MSPRLTNILLGVALLSCGIYAYQWHSQLQSLRADLDELSRERDRLNRRITELKEAKPSLVEAVIETSESEPTDIIATRRPGFSPADERSPSPEFFRGGGDGRARFIGMLDNPEIQHLMTVQQKAALDSRFSALFRSLNLSPADLEKFKSLLVEKQAAASDARILARGQGLTGPESRDALRQIIANAQTEVDNTIRSTLGEATFAQYQHYEQTQSERNLVTQLQQRLSYSTAPLTDTQSNQVIALLAANNPNQAKSATGTRTGQVSVRGNVPITDAVISGSQNILTSTQISALTQLQQEQQARDQLTAQMRAARRSAPGNTNSGAGTGGTISPPAKP